MSRIDKWSILAAVRFLLASVVAVNHLGEFAPLGILGFIPKFGAFESIVGNFAVDVGDTNDHAGIRWFELHRTGGGNFVLNQEATYAPDALHRWNGSIGQDRDANIALDETRNIDAVYVVDPGDCC